MDSGVEEMCRWDGWMRDGGDDGTGQEKDGGSGWGRRMGSDEPCGRRSRVGLRRLRIWMAARRGAQSQGRLLFNPE